MNHGVKSAAHVKAKNPCFASQRSLLFNFVSLSLLSLLISNKYIFCFRFFASRSNVTICFDKCQTKLFSNCLRHQFHLKLCAE